MKRPLKSINQDLKRVDQQIHATLGSSRMNAEDRQITLQGFINQKELLKNERERHIRDIDVKDPIVLAHEPNQSFTK